MNLKLYAIKVVATGKIIPDTFFPSKLAAKQRRDALGKDTHCVTYGPDHRHYNR